MRIQLVLDRWHALRQHRDTAHKLRQRLHRSKQDADAEFARDFMSDKVFKTHDAVHQKKVWREIETRTERRRQQALSVGLYGVVRPLPEFEREVSTFKQTARRAPHPLD